MKPRYRRCTHCARLLQHVRTGAKFCSVACRVTHFQRRVRTARALAIKRRCLTCRKRILVIRRVDVRYCSARCRQRGYRERRKAATAAAAKPHKAYQRTIRERLAAEDKAGSAELLDIRSAEVRAITRAEAKAIIMDYEWLGTMPVVSSHCFGIFFDGQCGGAVVYGAEPSENLGVWNRYGFNGKIIALLRGACRHWAHPHAASKLIRASMKLLPARYEVVTASVDADAGEIGTVYQAAGFDYVGIMRQGGRTIVRVNGKHVSERQAGRLADTRGARALAKLGFDAISVPRRARYFAFRGSRRDCVRNRLALAHLLRPYPKRACALSQAL